VGSLYRGDRGGNGRGDRRDVVAVQPGSMFNQVSSDGLASVVSMSFGGCEFGDEASEFATVVAAGIRCDHVVFDARATTVQVERLFATSIHTYAQGQYGTRFAPAASITVPADLAPFVSSVVLDNAVTHFAPHHGGLASSGFHF